MEYRILGPTALKTSAIAIGTWQLSGSITLDGKADGFTDVGRDQVINLIHACEDLGINTIDSAEIYGDGEGERRVGKALQGRRDRWIVSTKFGLRRGDTGKRVIDCHPQTIRKSLEGSLDRLQTDYVDLYLYHSPPNAKLLDEGKEILDTLKQEGKIRFYGISTDDANLVEQLSRKNATEVVMFSQSLLTSLVQSHSLGGMIRGVFEAGLLTGKYFQYKPQLAKEDIRSSWMHRTKTEQYAVYQSLVPTGYSMTALALRYVLDFDTTHTVVLGAKRSQITKMPSKPLNSLPLVTKPKWLWEP
jgi:aryl-alcohol dehydrogenase-like predicted oxidoreductase